MALLFILSSEGRDHRLDHILRVRRKNFNRNSQLPKHSYSPLNAALFKGNFFYCC